MISVIKKHQYVYLQCWCCFSHQWTKRHSAKSPFSLSIIVKPSLFMVRWGCLCVCLGVVVLRAWLTWKCNHLYCDMICALTLPLPTLISYSHCIQSLPHHRTQTHTQTIWLSLVVLYWNLLRYDLRSVHIMPFLTHLFPVH